MSRIILLVFVLPLFLFANATTEDVVALSDIQDERVSVRTVPEPTIQALLGLGVLALLSRRPRN